MRIINFIFAFLSALYISAIFLLADSPAVSTLGAFNPYSLVHIPLYGVLTLLLIFSIVPFGSFLSSASSVLSRKQSAPVLRLRLGVAGLIALVTAIADEIHQSFIPSREASLTDVILDLAGIILTLLLLLELSTRQYSARPYPLSLRGLCHKLVHGSPFALPAAPSAKRGESLSKGERFAEDRPVEGPQVNSGSREGRGEQG